MQQGSAWDLWVSADQSPPEKSIVHCIPQKWTLCEIAVNLHGLYAVSYFSASSCRKQAFLHFLCEVKGKIKILGRSSAEREKWACLADVKEKYRIRYAQYRGLVQITNWVKLKFDTVNQKQACFGCDTKAGLFDGLKAQILLGFFHNPALRPKLSTGKFSVYRSCRSAAVMSFSRLSRARSVSISG